MMSLYDSQPVSLADIITHDDQDVVSAHHHPQDPQQDTEHTDLDAEVPTFFVRALYDYQSSDASSLSFHRGDLIEVLTQLESGWWDGLLGDERGWFPSNYVEVLSIEEAETELHAREAAIAAATSSQPVANGQGFQSNWATADPQHVPATESRTFLTARADDYWMPEVTSSGQIFFVNTRTGEQSAEIPSTTRDPLTEESEFPLSTQMQASQSAQQFPPTSSVPLARSRSDTYGTTTSGASTIPTPTPGASGFTSISKDDEIPAPWVKRPVGEGAFLYMNQETGQVRWSAPSPVMGGRQVLGRLPTLMDTDESDWSAQDAYASSRGLSETGLSAPIENHRLSVYSDDSDIRPLDGSSPHIRSGQTNDHSASSGSPHRTDVTSNQDVGDHEHENASQPTSTASAPVYDSPSGESIARELQSQLLPAPVHQIDHFTKEVREAINAVVEAVGIPHEPPPPGEQTIMASKVAAVVTAVRNLLYVSGTLTTSVSNIHFSRQFSTTSPGSSTYTEEALHESARTPLQELKQYQRKVTATLSKLVLSARAADSSPDWPYDDATTRVDSDASELERAVNSFVMEVHRLEILNGIVLAEKRLEGVLISAEGLAGVGTTIFGAGQAGDWRGMGFVPADGGEGQSFPQWTLSEEAITEIRTYKAIIDEGLDALDNGDNLSVEALVPRIRHIVSYLSAFLSSMEDIDVARSIDVDGIIYPSPHPVDPALVEEYNGLVQQARYLIRKLEADKQAVYDHGSSLWTDFQAGFADHTAATDGGNAGLHLNYTNDRTSLGTFIRSQAGALRSAIFDTADCYEALFEVSRKQADAYRHGVRGSIGLRDGQISPAQRHRMSIVGQHGLDDVPHTATDPHLSPNLDLNLGDSLDDDEDVVDVGFALGRSKAKTQPAPAPQAVQLQAPIPPTSRSVSPSKSGPWPSNGGPSKGSRAHTPALSVSTAAPTYREVETDRDGASTIRQSTDVPPPNYEDDEDDEDFDLNPVARRASKMKSPARAHKITKIFGDDAPAHYLATQNAHQQPWFLQNENDPKSILINPDGGVRGGTLRALVERLTLHNYRDEIKDAVYNDTFLITFKSFTTVDELFDLLVERFNIEEPKGLTTEEHKQWVDKKQTPIRFRVINILRSMLMESHVLEKEDMHILNKIHDFAQSVTAVVPPAKQLILMVERAQNGGIGRITKPTALTPPPPPILPKKYPLKLLDIDVLEMARQLTIMESKLYLKIRPMECLARAKEQQGEDDSIKKIIGTSNKIASWVAQQVLSKEDPRRRGAFIKHFIVIAEKCRELRNFSTMAALIAGLNSPPIRRLKRTWETVNARFTAQLDDVEKTLDSGKNFTGYRQLLATVEPPCIPFLGVYLTVLTFIQDGNKDLLAKEGNLINFNKRQKAAEVIREIKKYQSRPYNLKEIPQVQEWLETSLNALENAPDFWEISMAMEPREREDEKMARLLQESGFL
ncbi:hypothetical protein FRB99_006637 [Tulasnella sp. 403]|nr:hypothetical protein FRB99_006637 [Tulasnella sp. 403]